MKKTVKMRARAMLGCVAAAALSASADAATYFITYTGYVSQGFDQSGEFGASDTELDGLAFEAVYTLTDPTPGATRYDDGVLGNTEGGTRYAGSATTYGTSSPVSARITIGGTTRAISGEYYGIAQQVNDLGGDTYRSDDVYHNSEERYLSADFVSIDRRINNEIFSNINEIVSTSDYRQPLSYAPQAGDSNGGYVVLDAVDQISGIESYAFAYLVNDRVTITAADAVPEPASWMMMIAGFGLAGGLVRSRSRKTQTATI